MDQASKFFLVMLVAALVGGFCVVVTNRDYRPAKILVSNTHYYPEAPDAPPAPEHSAGTVTGHGPKGSAK